MPIANRIPNLANNNHKKTSQSTTHLRESPSMNTNKDYPLLTQPNKSNNIYEMAENAQILLMDLAKALENVNLPQLWTTIYKKGPPLAAITHLREGRRQTTLRAKYRGKYGKPELNNIGVPKWSEISAMLL